MKPAAHRTGAVALLGAGVLWGGAGSAGRMMSLVGAVSPVGVSALRMLGGCLGLTIATLVLGRRWPHTPLAWRRVLTIAGLTTVYQLCFFSSVALGSVSVATLVALGTSPVIVTVVEAITRHRLSPRTVVTLVCALAGLVLLVGPNPGQAAWLPVLLSTIAGASFAAMTLLTASPVPSIDPVSSTGAAMGLAGVALAIVWAVAQPVAVSWTPTLGGWVLLLGLVCTAIPYGLYFSGLTHAPASLGALCALLEPLTATLIAVTAFGERLGVLGWIGAALLASTVGLAAIGSSPRRRGRAVGAEGLDMGPTARQDPSVRSFRAR